VSGFVALAVLFFCAMISAVWFFGKEPKEAKAGETARPVSTTAPAPAGDPAAGKALFAANGCSSCHTFKPAGATGKVGPDLDNLAADAKKANRGSLEQYVVESINDPNAYVVPGFPKGVMPPFASLGDRKIADLVAFLTRKP
jgi:mono/diheme cytochrome c family protein